MHLLKKRTSLLGLRAPVKLGTVSPQLEVPDHIRRPPYVGSRPPAMESVSMEPVSGERLEAMRDAAREASAVLAAAGRMVAEGVTTDAIDRFAHALIVDRKCYPSPLGYEGFPKSLCSSVNEVLCHGIPDDRPLVRGDIVNLDVSVFTARGVHGDCSDMFVVGGCDAAAARLIDVTRGAVRAAVAVCGPEVPFAKIGETIEKYVSEHSSFTVVDEFTGHGIGAHFHMLPYIVHTPNEYPGVMRPGHIFTIEPVVVEGSPKFRILDDKWTAVSRDFGRGAQVEHTVLITENGVEVLT